MKRHLAFRRLRFEQCEPRHCLSIIGFTAHEIATVERIVYSTTMGDMDGDGDLDVVFATSENKVAWYENTLGEEMFGTQRVVSTSSGSPRWVTLGDADGDDDLDVFSAFYLGDKIAWYENTDARGVFGPQQVITTDVERANWVAVGDVDSDGDLDVFGREGWYRNTDAEGSFGSARTIVSGEFLTGGFIGGYDPIAIGDMNGDGNLDVVVTSGTQCESWWCDGEVVWYDNETGIGDFEKRRQKDATMVGVSGVSMAVGDIDGDSDLDVLYGADGFGNSTLAWFENTDGVGTLGPQRIIAVDSSGTRGGLVIADLDDDGDFDVVSAEYGRVAWYENTDGAGTFGPARPLRLTPLDDEYTSVAVGDLDGDGDLDVVCALDDFRNSRIIWFESDLTDRANGLPGDADENGTVELADFLKLSESFGSTDAAWEDGDFNGDRAVDFADFLLMSANFGATRPR